MTGFKGLFVRRPQEGTAAGIAPRPCIELVRLLESPKETSEAAPGLSKETAEVVGKALA